MPIPKEFPYKPTGKTLGEGGQGKVHEVVDEFGVKWALKELATGKRASTYKRFSREIETLTKLDNPHVIKVLDYSEPFEDFQYYLMELHEGAHTLKELIADKALPNPFYENPERSVRLFHQIAICLAGCEVADPPIVHRDISPANILVLPDLSIKVIDFGICQIEGEETITLTDEGLGTRYYAAPECAPGAAGGIDIRTDLYSAGKVMWSAITSKVVFERETPVFTNQSMSQVFMDNQQAWHLHHIFEKTIRVKIGHRYKAAIEAVRHSREILQLIESAQMPLEWLNGFCTRCGIGQLSEAVLGPGLFSSSRKKGVEYMKCDYCGYIFVLDLNTARNELERRRTLE